MNSSIPPTTNSKWPRPEIQQALRGLDEVNLQDEFSLRGCVMKNIPRFLRGLFRCALRLALREITVSQGDQVRSARGWKLFMLLPRLLLFRPPRGGNISKQKLIEPTVSGFRDNCWTPADPVRRSLRQHAIVRDPIPRALMELVPSDFELDEARFGKNLRSSKRGAAGGPSSMTTEHLRPLLDSPRDPHLLFDACQLLATAKVSQEIKDAEVGPYDGSFEGRRRRQRDRGRGRLPSVDRSHHGPTAGKGLGSRRWVRMRPTHVASVVRDEP